MRGKNNAAEARLMLLRLLVLAVAVILVARLWQLQMVEGQSYRVLADRNRFREVDVAAPRGVIYDRNGAILARNRPSFTITVVPADMPKDQQGQPDDTAELAVLDRLFELLTRPVTPLSTLSPALTPVEVEAKAKAKTTLTSTLTLTATLPADRQPWIRPRAEVELSLIHI